MISLSTLSDDIVEILMNQHKAVECYSSCIGRILHEQDHHNICIFECHYYSSLQVRVDLISSVGSSEGQEPR